MAKKADFSADEWKALRTGLLGASMFVSLSDRDFTDIIRNPWLSASYGIVLGGLTGFAFRRLATRWS